MAFVSSKSSKSSKQSNLPDYQLVIKVPTSKGFITLGKLGLYNESSLHSKVIGLDQEQLIKLISKAELSITTYSSSNTDDNIELVIE